MEVLESPSLSLPYQFVGYARPNASLLPFPWTLAVFTQLPPHAALESLEEWVDETTLAAEATTITFLVQRVGRFENEGEVCVEEGYAALNPFWTFKELHYLPFSWVGLPFHVGLGEQRRGRDFTATPEWAQFAMDYQCKGVLCRAIPWTLSARWSLIGSDATTAAAELLASVMVQELQEGILKEVLSSAMHFLLQLETTAHILGHYVLNPARYANYEMSSSRVDLTRIRRFAAKLVDSPSFPELAQRFVHMSFGECLSQIISTVASAWLQDQADGMGLLYTWPLKHHFAIAAHSGDPGQFHLAYVRWIEAMDWAISAQLEREPGTWVDLSDSRLGRLAQTAFGIFTAAAFLPHLPEEEDGGYVPNEVAWQSVTRVHTPLTTRVVSYRDEANYTITGKWDSQILVQNFLLSHPFTRYQLIAANASPPFFFSQGTPAIVWLTKIVSHVSYLLAPSGLGAGGYDLQQRLVCLMEYGMTRRAYREDSGVASPLHMTLSPSSDRSGSATAALRRLVDQTTQSWNLRRLVDQTTQSWNIWEPIQVTSELKRVLGSIQGRAFRLAALGLIPFCKDVDGDTALWLQYNHQGRVGDPPLSKSVPLIATMPEVAHLTAHHMRPRVGQGSSMGGSGRAFDPLGMADRPKKAFVVFSWHASQWCEPMEALVALNTVSELLQNCAQAVAVIVTSPFEYTPNSVALRDVAAAVPWMPLRESGDMHWKGKLGKDIPTTPTCPHGQWWAQWSSAPANFSAPLLSQIKSVHNAARGNRPGFHADPCDATHLVLLRALLHLPHRLETCGYEQMSAAKEGVAASVDEARLFLSSAELRAGFVRGEEATRQKIMGSKSAMIKIWVSMEDVRQAPLRFWEHFHSRKRCWADVDWTRIALIFHGTTVDDETPECARIWLIDTFMGHFCTQYIEGQ